MKIGMIGLGFVGGTTSKIFETKHEVMGYDPYKKDYKNPEVLKNAKVVFICVPTPMKPSGEIDLSTIHTSIKTLDDLTDKWARPIVTIRSTIVPGTTDNLKEKFPNFDFTYNPEFLREKNAVKDMIGTERIIIGSYDKKTYKKVAEVYKQIFSEDRTKYINTTPKTSEMIKYASNVMLAGQIALANEIYQICKKTNVNYDEVKNAICLDSRMGKNLDVPGPDGDFGFGGKCFPKDLNALIYLARENNYRPYLFEEIWRSNRNVRTDNDWENIPGATSENNSFKKE